MITSARNPEREKPDTDQETPVGPNLEQQDWEAIEGGELEPVSVPDNGDLRYPEKNDENSGELPEEDDNPYQQSDTALPDDPEEEAIARNPSRDDGRFHGE